MRKLVCLLLALGALSYSASALTQDVGMPKMDAETLRAPTKIAQDALGTFAALVNDKNYRQLGFDNAAEVRSASLGAPMPELMIRLDELKNYQSGRDPRAILRDTRRLTYPVVVAERTRSSVTVASVQQGWKVVEFGAPSYVRSADSLRAELAARDGQDPRAYAIVRVPALNAFFLGTTKDNRVLLTPIVSQPELGLQRGQTKPAEEVLAALVERARAHNGLPS